MPTNNGDVYYNLNVRHFVLISNNHKGRLKDYSKYVSLMREQHLA